MPFIYIIAPGLTAYIAHSGKNTAGETYSLVCSVTAPSQPTISWLDDGGMAITPDSSRTVSATTGDISNGYPSTLAFNPLSASHAGTYTCRVTVGSEMATDAEVVSVQSKYYRFDSKQLFLLYIVKHTHTH